MSEISTDNVTVDIGTKKLIFVPDANKAIENVLLDNREDVDILMSIANDKKFVNTLSECDKDYLTSCIQEASNKARLLRC